MHCNKCDNQLQHCVCPDLGERIAAIEKSNRLYIEPVMLARYKAQAERNLKPSSREIRSFQCQACGYETDGPHQLFERGGFKVCEDCLLTNPPIVPTTRERLVASIVMRAITELKAAVIVKGTRRIARLHELDSHLSKAIELLEGIYDDEKPSVDD